MKKIVLFLAFISIGLLLLESCHKSYVWGKTNQHTPTKFRSDKRTIKR